MVLCKQQECFLQKKTFQVILVIIFLNIKMFQYRSDLAQVKQDLIFSIKKIGIRVASLVAEQLKTNDRTKLGYSGSLLIKSKCSKIKPRKTPNTDTFHAVFIRDIVQFSIFHPGAKLWQQQSQRRQKQKSKFCDPV